MMRLQDRGWVWVWVLLAGCSLGYDTSETPFQAPGDLLGGGDTSVVGDAGGARDTATDSATEEVGEDSEAPDVATHRDGLGVLCGASGAVGEDCVPGSERWPACASAPCQEELGEEARCVMGYSLYGYCSAPCVSDDDCVGDPNEPFSASLRCVQTDMSPGWCRPGSQEGCEDDLDCGVGEVCKLARSAGGWSAVCEAATPGGVGRGMFCNDDPSRGSVVLCENDLCLDDICAALCAASGAAPNANYCRDGNLSCQAEGASWLEAERLGGASVSAGLCAPRRCAGPESCDEAGGERVYCALERVRLGEEGGLRGGCRRDNPRQDGSLALGEACGGFGEPPELERCASRTCVGFPPNYFCTGLCDSDADCGEEQRCRVDRLEVSGEVLFVNLCGYARGSQTPCADNRGCDGGEVCAPFTFGQVGPSGKTLRGGRREGLCIVPVPSGVPTGSACEEQGCLAPGTCLPSGAGGVRLCADVCDPGDFTACELGSFCEEFVVVTDEEHEDGGALTQGWCVGF